MAQPVARPMSDTIAAGFGQTLYPAGRSCFEFVSVFRHSAGVRDSVGGDSIREDFKFSHLVRQHLTVVERLRLQTRPCPTKGSNVEPGGMSAGQS